MHKAKLEILEKIPAPLDVRTRDALWPSRRCGAKRPVVIKFARERANCDVPTVSCPPPQPMLIYKFLAENLVIEIPPWHSLC